VTKWQVLESKIQHIKININSEEKVTKILFHLMTHHVRFEYLIYNDLRYVNHTHLFIGYRIQTMNKKSLGKFQQSMHWYWMVLLLLIFYVMMRLKVYYYTFPFIHRYQNDIYILFCAGYFP